MRFYDTQNIKKFYLSPYAECRVRQDTVAFMQTVFCCSAQIPVRRGKAEQLLRGLQAGVSYTSGVWLILRCCRVMRPRHTFNGLLSGGILE